MKKQWVVVVLVSVFGIAACGGGGGDGGTPQLSGTPSTPSDTSGSGGGTSAGGTDTPAPPSGPTTTTSTVAMIVALPGPPGGMQLRDLNDNGHAAGIATTGSFPMSVSAQNYHIANADNFYQGDGTAFPTTFAGSNAAGVIAGLASPSGQPAFAYTWDGAGINRIVPPTDETIRGVIGIADDGAVIVNQTVGGQTPVAMRYRDGVAQVLPAMTAAGDRGRAEHASNNGTVLGAFFNSEVMDTDVFVWRIDGSTRVIPSLRRPSSRGFPVAINNNEHILVVVLDTCYLDRPEGNLGLGKLPGNITAHIFSALNDRSDAVGRNGDGTPLVYLYGESTPLHDLNQYAESGKLGWHFLTAERINNRRQILGRGTFNGQERWYLLTLK